VEVETEDQYILPDDDDAFMDFTANTPSPSSELLFDDIGIDDELVMVKQEDEEEEDRGEIEIQDEMTAHLEEEK